MIRMEARATNRTLIKDSDQTAQMHSMIWIFDGHTCQCEPFAWQAKIMFLKLIGYNRATSN